MEVLLDFIKAYEEFKVYGLDVKSMLSSKVDEIDLQSQKDLLL